MVKVTYKNPELGINKTVEIPAKGKGIINQCWNDGGFYETQRHGMLSGCKGSVPTIDLKGKTVIDVGANVGNHSIFFAEVCGAAVYAIEPHPENYKQLMENAASIGQVVAMNTAAGAKDGKTHISGDGMTAESGKEGTEVKMIKLDSLTKEGLEGLALIKIDVEGYEYEVLKGARNTLKKHKPILFIEIGKSVETNADEVKKISDYLAKLGYKIYGCKSCGGANKAFVFNATPTYRFDCP